MRAAWALTILVVASAFDWRVQRDPTTHVAAWMWGGRADAPGAGADPARAEAAARAFIAAHRDALAPGVGAGDLHVVANQVDNGLRTVAFEQRWRGMRVVGGHTGVVIGRDRIVAASSTIWPNVQATVPAGTPRGERVVLPIVAGASVSYVVADLVGNVYFAPDGRELRRDPAGMDAAATLQYNAGYRHANGPRANFPASFASITVNALATTTASDGTFSWTGTSPSAVAPSTSGPYVNVVNLDGAPVTDMLTAMPNMPLVWNLATDELADAQLSAFIYASTAKARARVIDPGIASWLDMPFNVKVNDPTECRAYSTGDDIDLGRSGESGCENQARVGDVVMHEFGHAFHKHALIAGMGVFEAHLSEGLADYFAANITNDPAVGRGYFKNDLPLRDIDPDGSERVYPIDMDFDPHQSGLIISGALWDLRKALVASMGTSAGVACADKIFLGVVQRASDIGSTFMAALLADDDDADLSNGTPNYCAIERAFGEHGLVNGYQPTIVTPPTTDRLGIAMSATVPTGTACPARAVTGITITWRLNDGVSSQFDLATDDNATWTGDFPDQDPGSVIYYTADVRFDDGSLRSFPDNPADPYYQLFTGGAKPLWCEPMDTDPRWPQSANGSVPWEWAVPQVDPITRDPDAAFTGDHVLGTNIIGSGNYRFNLVSTIDAPAVDVSAFQTVRLQYQRWLTVEDSAFDKATIEANGTEVWRNATSVLGNLDHIDREWRFHDIDVTPYVSDGSIQVRWTLTSDSSKQLGGWTLDDVCIVGLLELPRCGDGERDEGEQCDDGNTESNDGCSSTCIDEVTAGGGGCCSSSRDARGTWLLALLVAAFYRRRRASSLVPSVSVSERMP